MEHVIELLDARKEYRMGRNVVVALDGVTFRLPPGTLAAVVGPSGSGKTTLLNLMGALDRPTSGRVLIGGADLGPLSEAELTAHRRRTVGFVFQDFGLIPNLSALENVMLPMEFAGVPKAERRQRGERLLAAVRMSHRASHRPGRLSGGEQQRVAIARALANDPAILLADEPTGNLDSKTGVEIVEFFRRIVAEDGKTVVVVTHDEKLVEGAHQKFHLVDGRIAQRPRQSAP
ncbi:MAG: ABC transporter ATP-binding protein [Nitrospinota bacterium]